MPALAPTNYYGEIVWLGHVPDIANSMRSASLDAVGVSFDGFEGEGHSGRTRASCVRVTSQHPEGTEIANARQLTILSLEELDMIAKDCELDEIDPIWLGASIIVKGIPDFTHVPPNARLQGPDGVTVVVDMENRPCILPGKEIQMDKPGHGPKFKPAAMNRRGVTAWVERPGRLEVGQKLRLHIPDQRVWNANKNLAD